MTTPVKQLSDAELATLFGVDHAAAIELDPSGRLVRHQFKSRQAAKPAAELTSVSDALRGPRWD